MIVRGGPPQRPGSIVKLSLPPAMACGEALLVEFSESLNRSCGSAPLSACRSLACGLGHSAEQEQGTTNTDRHHEPELSTLSDLGRGLELRLRIRRLGKENQGERARLSDQQRNTPVQKLASSGIEYKVGTTS